MEIDVELLQPLQIMLGQSVGQPSHERIVDPYAPDRISSAIACTASPRDAPSMKLMYAAAYFGGSGCCAPGFFLELLPGWAGGAGL